MMYTVLHANEHVKNVSAH